MATRQNLIDTYQNNPTLQSRYTQQQYLDLFGFGQSTTTPTPPPTQPTPPPAESGIQNIIGQNLRDEPANRNLVDFTDYSFNKKNYAPGGKLEINPAALQIGFNQDGTAKGIASFPQTAEQAAFQARLDADGPFYGPKQQFAIQAGTVPTKMSAMQDGYFTGQKTYKTPRTIGEQVYASQLSQGDPAQLREFMEANIEGLPGDLTRQELVDMYNDYSQFFGRGSNYAAARVPGQVSSFISSLPYVGPIKKGLETFFGPPKDRSIQSKYAVDNAGYGQGTSRDEFGTFTGGKTLLGKTKNYVERMDNRIDFLENDFFGDIMGDTDFEDLSEEQIQEMKQKNGFNFKQLVAYKQRTAVEKLNEKFAEQVRQKELQEKIEKERKKGKTLSQIGREQFTGEGQAFQAGNIGKQTVTGGKVQKSSSVPGGKYGSPRKDGGLINGYDDGGMVYLYDRKEMADGGEVESYEDIIDAYENGVGVLKGESLTDYIRRNRIKLMDPMGDLEKALFGKANGGRVGLENGGQLSESDFPFLINRPGENMGRKKPGLDYYDKYEDSPDDEYPIIEIPMGKMMKKKTKKKKKKKAREDYSDGGRVYLYDRQD